MLSFDGVQVSMAKIPVGECVRGRLQRHNDGMHLGQGPNERVVDVEVNHKGCEGQSKRHIDTMSPGHQYPC